MANGYYSSYQQADQQRQLANDIATQEYNNALLAGQGQDRALNQAKFAWQQTMDKAGLTGKFEDQWTMPSQQWFTQQFGTWMPGGPQAGQQTLSAQQQAYAQALGLTNAFGQYYAPGQTPTSGQQTLTAQQQAFMQDLQNRQFGLSQQTQQQQTANQYLTLLSNLRGPADWAKYQEVLGATPGGMRDLVAAAMGQYVPGGGATSGMQPQAMNLNTLMGQVAGGNAQAPYQQATGVQMPGAQQTPAQSTYTPMGSNQAAYAPNNQIAQPEGRASVYAQPTTNQESLTNPTIQAYQAAQQAAGNGTNTMGAQQRNQMNLPAPNQIASQSWRNLAPSQQQMMLGAYEAQGWHKPDVEALMNQALPKYAANAPSAGTWRMQR